MWSESYLGGSPEAERVLFEDLARKIMRAQLKNAAGGKVVAGFQAKGTYAAGAHLAFADDLAPDLRAGFAQPGASYPATVRFSNAEGRLLSDKAPDLRGVAIRVADHDLTMTSAPVAHARDAKWSAS